MLSMHGEHCEPTASRSFTTILAHDRDIALSSATGSLNSGSTMLMTLTDWVEERSFDLKYTQYLIPNTPPSCDLSSSPNLGKWQFRQPRTGASF